MRKIINFIKRILSSLSICKGCRRVGKGSSTCQACSRYQGKRTDWYEPDNK
jgi:recombinational DNA repair protein RecR